MDDDGMPGGIQDPAFRTLPPTRTKPSASTSGCNTNRGLDSGGRELFLRDSISREK